MHVDYYQAPSVKELFRQLFILTAPSCYILEAVKYALTFGNGTQVGEGSARITRQSQNLRLQFNRLRKSDKGVSHDGAEFFN